ncbi:TetR/AcrR family transcriptional regulator [Neisseria sp. Ec49-e6-T10]|uniref:TetR/AcrR family transcriptional regulator n=1 Tax=Neisseria sp. Ec49-e6-T10 TaxID=3140744 RepID=UPI003EBE415A
MVKDLSQKKTYQKIVAASLELFNQDGERHVSTNHIAAHLGISPGNLYYYFHNKDEIILQLFKQYRQESIERLSSNGICEDIGMMIDYFQSAFALMWHYRFLFSDLTTLIDRSDALANEYQHFSQEHMGPIIRAHFNSMIVAGVVQMTEEQVKSCIFNIWLITKYWFSFDASLHQGHLTENTQERGMVQVLSLLQPYVSEQYLNMFNEALNKFKVTD